MTNRIGRGILFACAVPLLVAEEVRALASVKGDLAAAREGRANAEGQRNEARRVADVRDLARTRECVESHRLREELAGRERMVSDAKRDAAISVAAVSRLVAARDALDLECSEAKRASAKLHVLLSDAQRAATELQGEVDRAHAERDTVAVELADMRAAMLRGETEIERLIAAARAKAIAYDRERDGLLTQLDAAPE